MSRQSAHILHGPFEEVENKSLGQIILDSLRRRDRSLIALVDAHSGECLTCGELLDGSVSVADSFRKNGIRKNDIIALISENNLNYVIPILGALYVGAIVQPANPAWTYHKMANAFKLSKPKLIICSETALDVVNKLKLTTDYIEEVVVFGPKPNGEKSFNDLLKSTDLDLNDFETETLDPIEQVAFILSSSGTTGLPKGVMITHRNMVLTNHYWRDPKFGNYREGDCTVAPMPLFHIFGLNLILVSIVASFKYVMIDQFSPELYLKCIEKYRANKLSCPPSLIVLLAKSLLVDSHNLSTIEEIVYGTASLKPEIEELAQKRLRVNLKQAYGATEMAGPCTMIATNSFKSGSCGVILPNFLAKVRDADTKEVLGCGKVGELCFKGDLVMKGYLNDVEATMAAFDEDGFYVTGDMGYYDQDGFFFIVDRLKDIIKCKEVQIAPAELEGILLSHPSVMDVAVIGIPDPTAGELPFAFVVKQPNRKITEKELVEFVAEHVYAGKQLDGGVRFVNEIPKTPSGKILKWTLRNMVNNKNL